MVVGPSLCTPAFNSSLQPTAQAVLTSSFLLMEIAIAAFVIFVGSFIQSSIGFGLGHRCGSGTIFHRPAVCACAHYYLGVDTVCSELL